MRCKNFTSSWGGFRYLPYAFTEQGIYMLMTVQNFDYYADICYADIVIECYWGSIRKNKRYLSM
ncbi:hypothetical protein CG398_03395 [Bifidobacteriaceae bacterium NR003]|nr:hypothetical protein CG398_03395 [Bifidobacteriaceae bacterium NR003]